MNWTATVPMTEPIKAESIRYFTSGQLTFLFFSIIYVAVAVPTVPCSLFVPSADKGGIPLKTRAGRTISPPPPAKVSRKPAMRLARNKRANNSAVMLYISNTIPLNLRATPYQLQESTKKGTFSAPENAQYQITTSTLMARFYGFQTVLNQTRQVNRKKHFDLKTSSTRRWRRKEHKRVIGTSVPATRREKGYQAQTADLAAISD